MANLTRITAGVLLVLALLLAGFAWMLARRPATPPQTAAVAHATFPVVVATQTLVAGKPVSAEALRVQMLPIHPGGAFSDPTLVAGRVPTADIAPDAPVLETQLSSGMADSIAPGQRAVAVRVDESNAVGNRVRAGNVVDVFFTLKRDGGMSTGGEIGRTQARLLMSKVRVLAFGNPAQNAAVSNTSFGTDPNGVARTAVLAVPVADVDKLTLAESAGRLVLALRNPKDDEVADPSAFAPYAGVVKTVSREPLQGSTQAAAGVALDELAGGAGSGSRAPAVPRPAPVLTAAARGAAATGSGRGSSIEVVRGGHAETVAW